MNTKKMTKSEMLDFIEKTGMIIDFNRNFLMQKSKDKIQDYYERAKIYESNKKSWKALFFILKTEGEPVAPKYYTIIGSACQEINCEQFVNKIIFLKLKK